jgi:hypothetical protein
VTGYAAPAIPGGSTDNWLDQEHPDYVAGRPLWAYALDHYTGEVLFPEKLPRYLIRRGTGEPTASYQERLRLADYKNHFGTVVDSLAGMLFGNEADASRLFARPEEKGLGDAKDPRSVAGRLTLNADGHGTGWSTLHKQLASVLSVVHCAWGLVTSPTGPQRVRYLSPLEVPDWEYDREGNLVAVKVCEYVIVRPNGLTSKPALVRRWTVYDLYGWQRWEKSTDTNGTPVRLTGEGDTGVYQLVDRDGTPALPIYPVVLPLKRRVGWLLSRNANTIFNLESARDFLVWSANFPKLKLGAGDAFFEKLVEQLNKGANVLQDDPASGAKTHEYIAPPTGPAEIASTILNKKIVDLYVTAFREYGDAAREKTATEVRQDVAAGVGAYLQMLKAALDDAENQALYRIEQLEWPGEPSKWGGARVERSDEFTPTDVQAVVDRLVARYFGKDTPVPVGRAGQIAIAKTIADYEGLEVEDGDVAAAVDVANLMRGITIQRELEVPAAARVSEVLALCTALGIIPALQTPPTPKEQLRGEIEAAARRLADASDNGAQRMGEISGSLNTPDLPPGDVTPPPIKPAPKEPGTAAA